MIIEGQMNFEFLFIVNTQVIHQSNYNPTKIFEFYLYFTTLLYILVLEVLTDHS